MVGLAAAKVAGEELLWFLRQLMYDKAKSKYRQLKRRSDDGVVGEDDESEKSDEGKEGDPDSGKTDEDRELEGVKTEKDLLDEASKEIDELDIHTNQIQIDASELTLFEHLTVYLIGARILAWRGDRESAKVGVNELTNALEIRNQELEIWLYIKDLPSSKKGAGVEVEGDPTPTNVVADNVALFVKTEDIHKKILDDENNIREEYTLNDRYFDLLAVREDLEKAEDYIRDRRVQRAEDMLESIIDYAAGYVAEYKRDVSWEDFIRTVSEIAKRINRGKYDSATERPVDRTEKVLDNMWEMIEKEREKRWSLSTADG